MNSHHHTSRIPIHSDLTSYLLPPSNPTPVIPSLSSIQIPKLSPSNPFNLTQHKNPPSFDFNLSATKRLRHGQSDYTESHFKISEAPQYSEMNGRRDILNQNQFCENNMIKIPHVSSNTGDIWSLPSTRQVFSDKQGEWMNIPLEQAESGAGFGLKGNGLVEPIFTSLSGIEKSGLLDYKLQQQLLRQLEQHRMQQFFVEKILQQLQRTQRSAASHIHQQLIEQMQQKQHTDRLLQYYHESSKQAPAFCLGLQLGQNVKLDDDLGLLSGPIADVEKSNSENSFEIPEFKVEECDQPMKLEDEIENFTNGKTSDEGQHYQEGYQSLTLMNQTPGNEEKNKALAHVPLKETLKESKRKRTYNYPVDYFGVLGKNLVKKSRNEPRRKNKWQVLIGGEEPEVQNEEKTLVSLEKENNEIKNQEEKTGRQKRMAHYVEDDSNVDYNYLLSVKITNDPITLGYENPTQKFMVLSGNKESESGTKETRLGDRYQAAISEVGDKDKPQHRRKFPELVWNPKMLSRIEQERYLNDLCKILKCETVNEERALKLLKRKNFKKEKVKINISKNEKFYSSFLVVTSANKDNIENGCHNSN